MVRIRVIGVGVGDPAYVTMAAARAIGETDVFFVNDKGATTADLVGARETILAEHARPNHTVVTIEDPPRAREAMPKDVYEAEVKRWRDARMERIHTAVTDNLDADTAGAFLVWGDPSLYDGTLRILDDLRERGLEIDYDVIPGISSLHALTAKHRTLLNRIAGSVLITTGRRLAKGWPTDADDVVVMLDTHFAADAYRGQGLTIYWGAYLGSADELLKAGPLDEVADEIIEMRTRARERKGWIMDTYLLRRGALL